MIVQNFNADWQFEKGSSDSRMNSFLGKSNVQTVHLPHDAMIHEPRTPNTPNGAQTGFYPGGEYIYQKRFTAPAEWRGKTVQLLFEGVYQTALVYVNGAFAAKSVNGYTDFFVDLTPHLKYETENLIKVIADNSRMPNSRWYTGSGIYRPVELLIGGSAYLTFDGVRYTIREADESFALLDVTAEVKSSSAATEHLRIRQEIAIEDKVVLQDEQQVILRPAKTEMITFRYCLQNPRLWSPESPDLYTGRTTVYNGDTKLDEDVTAFGVRTLTVDAVRGVRINGKCVKLRGACIHHDNGILGAADFSSAARRRCEQLKAAGFNAIRSAHNPASRALLNACDACGLLVMDELSDVWNTRKNPYDYAIDFAADWEQASEKVVAKDYNHPSVILYCVGNEISEAGTESGAATNQALCAKFRALDPTRYTTNALNGLMAAGYRLREIMKDTAIHFDAQHGKPGGSGGGSNALNSFMSLMAGEKGDYFAQHPLLTEALSGCEDSCDIIGLNYLTNRHVLEHTLHPHKPVLGTETYPADIVRLWNIVEQYPHVIGDFTWAGYDYLGEAGCGIFHYNGDENFSSIYPERTAYIGDLDLLGERRAISFFREIVYGQRKTPYIAVERMEHAGQTCSKTPWMFKDNIASWTWPGYEGKTATVDVYAAGDEAELLLNGVSLGRKPLIHFAATWDVPYKAGNLKAVNYQADRVLGEFELHTVQEAALSVMPGKLSLCADGEDLCFCRIAFADAAGNEDMHSQHKISVNVQGAGTLAALGSANPSSEECYDAAECKTYDGICMAVVRAGEQSGKITLTVTTGDGQMEQVSLSVV